MIIGVVGLGLIGGSLARAYHQAGDTVYGYDADQVIQDFVQLSGVMQAELTPANRNECDVIFLAIPVQEAIRWLEENAGTLRPETLVIDCCGVKRPVCEAALALEKTTDLHFIGGHPMAGRQVWGYKNSSADLFEGSVFVIVPDDRNDIRMLSKVKQILKRAGFTGFQVMTPEEHDEVIAFSSQLSHVVSNAFVKSGEALADGTSITGGSFRDMTRVAYLDEKTWAELMMENRDKLLPQIQRLTEEIGKYADALAQGDKDALRELLAEGRRKKEETEARTRRA